MQDWIANIWVRQFPVAGSVSTKSACVVAERKVIVYREECSCLNGYAKMLSRFESIQSCKSWIEFTSGISRWLKWESSRCGRYHSHWRVIWIVIYELFSHRKLYHVVLLSLVGQLWHYLWVYICLLPICGLPVANKKKKKGGWVYGRVRNKSKIFF